MMHTPDKPEYLTAKEIAERLRVKPKTVRRWLLTRRLTAYRFGQEWRVNRSDFETFIRASRHDADFHR